MVWGTIAHVAGHVFIRGRIGAQRFVQDGLEPNYLSYPRTMENTVFQNRLMCDLMFAKVRDVQ